MFATMLFPRKALLPLIGGTLLLALPSAQAAMVLSYEITNQGGVNVVNGPGTVNVLSAPASTTYGNTLPGGLATLVPPPSSLSNYNFYDEFIINVPLSTANAITSTIDFGDLLSISNLQVRLYEGTVPTLSTPLNLIEAWSTPLNAGAQTGIISVLPMTYLESGDYILEVRGLVDGQFGGSYAGVLNVANVPLPAAVWLLLSGLGVVGALSRRRATV